MEERDLNSSPEVDRLEREVVKIQHNISSIVSELDRRRQEFLSWRHQMSDHRAEMVVAGAAIAFLAAAALLGGSSPKRLKDWSPE